MIPCCCYFYAKNTISITYAFYDDCDLLTLPAWNYCLKSWVTCRWSRLVQELEVCFGMRLFAFRRIKGSLALICNTGIGVDCLANIICFAICRLCSTFIINCLVLDYEVITHGVMMLLMFELPFMVMSYIYKEVLRFIDSAAKFWSKLNYEY